MKTENESHQANIPRATVPLKKETFHVEFKVCGYGGGETVFEIEGSYDIPQGMLRENLHHTIHGNEVIFENAVLTPMKMAVIQALEGQFRRGTKQPVSTAADGSSLMQSSDLIGAISAHSAPDAAAPAADPLFPEETPYMPKVPFPPEERSAPAPMASRIVNPAVKNQPKAPRSPKGSGAALPGDEREKMAA